MGKYVCAIRFLKKLSLSAFLVVIIIMAAVSCTDHNITEPETRQNFELGKIADLPEKMMHHEHFAVKRVREAVEKINTYSNHLGYFSLAVNQGEKSSEFIWDEPGCKTRMVSDYTRVTDSDKKYNVKVYLTGKYAERDLDGFTLVDGYILLKDEDSISSGYLVKSVDGNDSVYFNYNGVYDQVKDCFITKPGSVTIKMSGEEIKISYDKSGNGELYHKDNTSTSVFNAEWDTNGDGNYKYIDSYSNGYKSGSWN